MEIERSRVIPRDPLAALPPEPSQRLVDQVRGILEGGVIDSNRAQARAFGSLANLEGIDLLGQASVSVVEKLAKQVGVAAAQTPWAIDEYKLILRTATIASLRLIERQVDD